MSRRRRGNSLGKVDPFRRDRGAQLAAARQRAADHELLLSWSANEPSECFARDTDPIGRALWASLDRMLPGKIERIGAEIDDSYASYLRFVIDAEGN